MADNSSAAQAVFDGGNGPPAAGGDSHRQQETDAPNKRHLPDEGGDGNQQPSKKRRKKNKNKKSKAQQTNKKSQQNRPKKKSNWIESCSDSVHRIPTGSAAPLTCVVTRAEIEEEPLLPKGVAKDGSENDASAAGCGEGEKDGGHNGDTTTTTVHEAQAVTPVDDGIAAAQLEGDKHNIAMPSPEFLSRYAKEKVDWKVPSTVYVDGEEKKLFIPVKRHSSAVGPTKWVQSRKKSGKPPSANFVHLPGGDNGDGITNPYPSSLVPDKFWAQRKRLFSRYDEGIRIGGKDDPEMWYSVTPESIANHVAKRMVNMIRQSQSPDDEGNETCGKSVVVLDPFCGCGGNSIAFARMNDAAEPKGESVPRVKVVAVDNNLSRLKMAAHNAAIYGIEKNDIVFIHADAVEVLNCYSKGIRVKNKGSKDEQFTGNGEKDSNPNHESCSGYALGGVELLPDSVDGIFLSPPWGGMDYGNEGGKAGFDPVSSISVESKLAEAHAAIESEGSRNGNTISVTTNGGELLSISAKGISKEDGVIAYFLPRNTSGISLGQTAVASGIDGCFELEQNVVNGKVKTITAYFGTPGKLQP